MRKPYGQERGDRTHLSVDPLHLSSLAALGVCQTPKDLGRFTRTEVQDVGGLHLEQRSDPANPFVEQALVLEFLDVVGRELHPCVRSFNLARHVGKLSPDAAGKTGVSTRNVTLETVCSGPSGLDRLSAPDHRVLNHDPAKSLAFVSVLERFLVGKASVGDGAADQENALRLLKAGSVRPQFCTFEIRYFR